MSFVFAAEQSRLQATVDWPPGLIFVLACIAVAAVVLSHRAAAKARPSAAWPWITALRVCALALVAWMVLGWTWVRRRVEAPELVVAIDATTSMRLTDVSQARSVKESRWRAAVELLDGPGGWLERWRRDYRVRVALVGEHARTLPDGSRLADLSPEQSTSRLGDALRSLLAEQRGRSTAAIVVVTDGAVTDGASLAAAAKAASERRAPLFFVGTGDDRPPRDVELREVLADDATFLGDSATIDAVVVARGAAGESIRVVAQDATSGETLDEVSLVGDVGGRPQTARLRVRPASRGAHEYVVAAEPIEGESNVANNRREIAIDARDVRLNVLWVQGRPSYEFRFAKNLLERKLNPPLVAADPDSPGFRSVLLEADRDYSANDASALPVFPERWDELARYDAIVLGDVDPAQLGATATRNIVRFAETLGRSILVASGPRHNPRGFIGTPLAALLPFEPTPMEQPVLETKGPLRAVPTAIGEALSPLALDDSPTRSAAIWREKLPPLWWALQVGSLRPGVRATLTTSGDSGEPMPLATLQYLGAGKVCFHAFDETYRWRAVDDGQSYERYWLQLIRFLCRSRLTRQSPPRIDAEPSPARRGEPVEIRVRFGDETLAPAADRIEVALEAADGARTNVPLTRPASAARGWFAGTIQAPRAGNYTIRLAEATLDESRVEGKLEVVAPERELDRPMMASAAMRAAAEVSGGRFCRVEDADATLRDLPKGAAVPLETLPATPIWNSPWLGALLVAMLAGEWLLRRRAGLI